MYQTCSTYRLLPDFSCKNAVISETKKLKKDKNNLIFIHNDDHKHKTNLTRNFHKHTPQKQTAPPVPPPQHPLPPHSLQLLPLFQGSPFEHRHPADGACDVWSARSNPQIASRTRRKGTVFHRCAASCAPLAPPSV